MGMTAWTDEAAWAQTRLPIAEAATLPGAAYTDPDFYELEQQQVFGGGWVGVALADEASVGKMLVREIGGRSILIVRDADGILHGFLNSCRHRGTEIADADCTVANTIRCPYHRWGYSLDGRLIATPQFDEAGIDGFDRDNFGLNPVRVAEWGCLIFASLDPDVTDLHVWLGDLPERSADYELRRWRSVDFAEVTVKANWKLLSENYQEYYHLAPVHPELAKVSRVKDHYRFQGPGMYCGQTTTPVSGDSRGEWTTMPTASGLGTSDATSGRFLAIFPNVLLSLLPNHVFVIFLQPKAPNLTVERCAFLLPPSTPEVPQEIFDQTKQFWFSVNDEDIDICQRSQRGLTRGGFERGRLSPRFEEPLHRFHNILADRFVGIERIPDGDPNDHEPRLGTGANPLPYMPGRASVGSTGPVGLAG